MTPETPLVARLPRRSSLVPTLLALALAAVVIAPSLARAKCMAGTLTAWPPPETPLPSSALILLDGFGDEQHHISALADGGAVHLVAPGHRVALTAQGIHVGAFGLTQAVLSPATPLKPATRYVLELTGADGQPVRTTTWHEGELEPIAWTTAPVDAPRVALTLDSPPMVTGQSFRRLGCGPSSHVDVSLKARSDLPMAVEVTVKELGVEGESTSYLVPVVDGVVRLGHGMCSGPFRLTGPERRFRAELTLRDAAGDAVGIPRAIEFDGVDPMGAFRKVQLDSLK